MEYILDSNQNKIKNNCLRYTFQKPLRFENQYISLTSMIFYNYFENISDKFKLIIKNKTQSHTINFKNGSYYVSDISKIIDQRQIQVKKHLPGLYTFKTRLTADFGQIWVLEKQVPGQLKTSNFV